MQSNIQKITDLKILIVDDSDFARTDIRALLQTDGYSDIGEAKNAETALKYIRDNKPHLVITDLVMPDFSGTQLTEKIHDMFDNINVIIMSSLPQEHVILDAISSGAMDFLPKPIHKEQLSQAVKKVALSLTKEGER